MVELIVFRDSCKEDPTVELVTLKGVGYLFKGIVALSPS